ncbi:MAG: hypothetical protein Q8M31_22775 [Beijerinckiaceae bacterium]|nr:hypothetical protein [Beijerinckiaceae bacterium]
MSSDEIVHRVRASVFAQEAEWRLVDDRLVWSAIGKTRAGDMGVIALDQVESVRLTNEPARVGSRMFCRLRTRDGAVALIASAHTAGVFSAQDRSLTYKALVRTLVARIAVANPKARFLTGLTPIVWWSVVLGLAGLLGALGALSVIAGREIFTTRILVGLALIALGTPNLVRWLTTNRPGAFKPANPPL